MSMDPAQGEASDSKDVVHPEASQDVVEASEDVAGQDAAEVLLWGVLGVVIFGLLGLSIWFQLRPNTTKPELPVIAEVPDFRFTNRDGSTLQRDDLLGQPWVADFIFTRCAVICPRMTQQMSRVVESLGDVPGVRFVSFSVDPEHDTPEVLEAYAQGYGAPDRWFFLTGDRAEIHQLSQKGFLLLVGDTSEADQAKGVDPIVHSNRFALVDAEGRIRSYYDAFDDVELERLLEDVRELSSQP